MSRMTILSLNIAEFGGLKDYTLELSRGLNIVRGNNESGKSTLLLFIMYMLYGLPKKAPKSSPAAYDKDRSLSWSGLRAEGSMEIESEGKRYLIERSNPKRNSSSEARIRDVETGEVLYAGREPGEVFFGISREAFESCVWCGQTRVSAISADGLSTTLSNLSLTADESVDGEAALRRLREARKQYKHEKGDGGLIFDAEQKRQRAIQRSVEIEKSLSEKAACELRKEELVLALHKAKEELEAAQKIRSAAQILAKLRRIEEHERRLSELGRDRKELAELIESNRIAGFEPDAKELAELEFMKGELARRDSRFTELARSSAAYTSCDRSAAEKASRIAERESEQAFCARIEAGFASSSKMRLIGIFGAIAAGLFVGLGFAFHLLFLAVAGIFAALSVLGFVAFGALKKKTETELALLGTDRENYRDHIKYCFEQREAFAASLKSEEDKQYELALARTGVNAIQNDIEKKLEQYSMSGDAPFTEGLDILIGRVRRYLKSKTELERKIEVSSKIADRDARELGAYDVGAMRESLPEHMRADGYLYNSAAAEAAIASALERKNRLDSELNETIAKILSLKYSEDELADTYREIGICEREIASYKERFEVLDRAYSALRDAYENMKRNFAPKIRERAGEYLDAVSGGKYSKLMLAEDMSVSVEDRGLPRSAALLSRGTADAVYISLRLALLGEILGEGVPFIMDETLCALDDTRAGRVLSMINDFVSQGNQCVIFTCHSRESLLCDGMNIAYSKKEI